MRTLLRLVFNRWVLAGLGLLSLSLLIWYGGDLLAIGTYRPLETPLARAVLIGLILAFFVGRLAWRAWKARRASARLLDGLAPKPTAGAAPEDPEVAMLRGRFQEAITSLKGMHRGVARQRSPLGWLRTLSPGGYIYELPWYAFIGAPGSGKTTALLNAGLRFPLADKLGQAKVQGVGGTRNCDWWFAEEAVLIDTAGRYTTQDSNRATDAAAWKGFLSLLMKHRPRCPLNGVIVTVSAAELLGRSATTLATEADAIRNRVHELQETFGIAMPIYVLVTKADLMAGFSEFFSDLAKEDRAQVWGFTAPATATDGTPAALSQFSSQFDALEKRLHERLIDRMQNERDPQRRALIYSFPQQFAAMREPLHTVLDAAFAPSRFAGTAQLRGVYFTSGTQEGSPLDRALGNMARAMGLEQRLLPPQRSSGRSYFLQRLLHDVIFVEAPLTGTNQRWERRRMLLRYGVAAATALLTAGLIAAWTVSYLGNRDYVNTVAEKVAPVTTQVAKIDANTEGGVSAILPVLDTVSAVAQAQGSDPHATPWSMGFGLSQMNKLDVAADNTYTRLLRDALLPRISARLEDVLRSRAESTEKQYDALKAYIMLYEPERMSATFFKTFITTDWEDNLLKSLPASQHPLAVRHLDALIERHHLMPALRNDPKLVAEARSRLAGQGLADRIYLRLKREGVGKEVPAFTIAAAAGPNASVAFRRESGQPLTAGVPGLFTRAGYDAFQEIAANVGKQLAEEEDWVLGTRAVTVDITKKSQIQQEVVRLYLEDYARIWQAFIRDIRLRTRNLQEIVETVKVLSTPGETPLPPLLKAIVNEVTLSERDEANKSIAARVTDVGAKTVERVVGSKVAVKIAGRQSDAERIVDEKFTDLRRFVRTGTGKEKAAVDLVDTLMIDLVHPLRLLAQAKDKSDSPLIVEPLNKLRGEADRTMPDMVRSAVTELSDVVMRGVQSQTRTILAEKLSQIAEFCMRAVNGRYPFVKTSDRDVTPEDFARLFALGGEFDSFITRDLAKEVDINTRPWTFRRKADGVGGETSEGLKQLQHAATIRDAFFRGGGRGMSLRFDFKPLHMDGIGIFDLDIDGQRVVYKNEPVRPIKVDWPGPRGSYQVRWISPPSMGGKSAVFDGPWALFRLFDANQIEADPNRPERVTVTFRDGPRQAAFEVTASSVQNPFRMRELEQFQCPTRL